MKKTIIVLFVLLLGLGCASRQPTLWNTEVVSNQPFVNEVIYYEQDSVSIIIKYYHITDILYADGSRTPKFGGCEIIGSNNSYIEAYVSIKDTSCASCEYWANFLRSEIVDGKRPSWLGYSAALIRMKSCELPKVNYREKTIFNRIGGN